MTGQESDTAANVDSCILNAAVHNIRLDDSHTISFSTQLIKAQCFHLGIESLFDNGSYLHTACNPCMLIRLSHCIPSCILSD